MTTTCPVRQGPYPYDGKVCGLPVKGLSPCRYRNVEEGESICGRHLQHAWEWDASPLERLETTPTEQGQMKKVGDLDVWDVVRESGNECIVLAVLYEGLRDTASDWPYRVILAKRKEWVRPGGNTPAPNVVVRVSDKYVWYKVIGRLPTSHRSRR